MFVVTTVRRGYLVEQLACSTAEGSEMYVGVQGKLTVEVLDFKWFVDWVEELQQILKAKYFVIKI